MNDDELKQYWETVRKFREEHCTKCGVFNKCKGDLSHLADRLFMCEFGVRLV